jgi:RNase P/RNase MRP subunit p29
MKTHFVAALALGFTVAAGAAFAQTPPVSHLRGTIEKVDGDTLMVKTRDGKVVPVKMSADAGITGVYNAKLADIAPGSFIGTAAAPQPDGSLKALEVTVFPKGMHGGEGSYGWDLTPTSTMTNGTVGDVVGSKGRTITVKYPNGEKQVMVPDDVPVVTFEVTDRSKLVPGAHVMLTPTKAADGSLSVTRVQVGEHGVVPPA